MNSPTAALIWEIWRRNYRLAWLVAGLVVFGWILNSALAENFRATVDDRDRLLTLNGMLAAGSILLVFGIFNYTEFNPQKEWTGFPYRLFALPVATWRLVALPMVLGVAAVELTFFAWVKLVFFHDELVMPGWLAVIIGAYLVFFQAILWTLAAFRILRMIVLALAGTSFIGVAFLPFLGKFVPSMWTSEKPLMAILLALALLAFLFAWNVIARQRIGGGRRENWLKKILEAAFDLLPRRRTPFASPAAAQFWFEWRRAGLLLPTAIAAILALVVAPISWWARKEEATTLWLLINLLPMPTILAAAMSKGFSKPDFWSADLALPAFLGVRPFSTGDFVVTKLKVAAASAVLSWALVIAFLCLWLPNWANLSQLSMVRIGFWMIYGHSLYPQYFIAALMFIAGMLLTWKCLVGGLWVGLSGSRKLFVGSALVYCLVAILGVTGLVIVLNHDQSFVIWVDRDPNELLSFFEWLVALAVIAKLWLAAFSWRNITRRRVRQYFLLWAGATGLLIALGLLLWSGGTLSLLLMSAFDFPPLDATRLKSLLILAALAAIPFARLGLANSTLTKNRHGDNISPPGSHE